MVTIMIMYVDEKTRQEGMNIYEKLKPFEDSCGINEVRRRDLFSYRSECKLVKFLCLVPSNTHGQRCDILYIPKCLNSKEYKALLYPMVNCGGQVFYY